MAVYVSVSLRALSNQQADSINTTKTNMDTFPGKTAVQPTSLLVIFILNVFQIFIF